MTLKVRKHNLHFFTAATQSGTKIKDKHSASKRTPFEQGVCTFAFHFDRTALTEHSTPAAPSECYASGSDLNKEIRVNYSSTFEDFPLASSQLQKRL